MTSIAGGGGAEGAFRTHHRYLEAWVRATADIYAPGSLVGYPRKVPGGVVAAFWADPFVSRIQKKDSDTDMIKRLLFNAWGTELHLALQEQLVSPEDEHDILALANQWAVVQAYYAIEKATVALVMAKGGVKCTSHEKTRTLYLDQWQCRHYPPWSLAFGHGGVEGAPSGAHLELDHNWENVHDRNCWAFLVTCLRTTRRNELLKSRLKNARQRKGKEKRAAWLKEETARQLAQKKPRRMPGFGLPRLTTEEKAGVEASTRSATFLDYLYRLRIRSNYEDTRMFTEGPSTPHEAAQMHRYLTRLVGWTLLLSELWIRRYMGTAMFDQLVDEWLSRKVAASADVGLSLRRQLLARS